MTTPQGKLYISGANQESLHLDQENEVQGGDYDATLWR
jgi:hypothetical protein